MYEKGKVSTFDNIHTNFPKKLAEICNSRKVKFVHVSALGLENAKNSKYAISKINGEKSIKDIMPESTIIKPSLVYSVDDNLTTRFMSLLSVLPIFPIYYQGKTKFTPIHVSDLTEIELIKRSIKNGKQVLCLNKDLSFPSENEELPGNGAVVKMIEDDLEITITSLGKPDLHFIKYCSDHNYNFDYVIGDRVDTDIFFGKQINAISILVETGIKNFESTDSADIKLKSFSEVVSFIS